MTDELKAIIVKQDSELTDEERSKIKEAVDAFTHEIDEVCRKHGLAYKSIVKFTEEGAHAALRVVAIEDQKTEQNA